MLVLHQGLRMEMIRRLCELAGCYFLSRDEELAFDFDDCMRWAFEELSAGVGGVVSGLLLLGCVHVCCGRIRRKTSTAQESTKNENGCFEPREYFNQHCDMKP